MCDDDVGVVQGVEQEKRWVDGGRVGTLGAEGSLLDTFADGASSSSLLSIIRDGLFYIQNDIVNLCWHLRIIVYISVRA